MWPRNYVQLTHLACKPRPARYTGRNFTFSDFHDKRFGVIVLVARSSGVVERPRDDSCLSVVSFSSKIHGAHFSFTISYSSFRFTSAYKYIRFCSLRRDRRLRGVKTHSGLRSERIRFPRGGGNFQTSGGDNIWNTVYVLRRHRSCRDYYYYIIINDLVCCQILQ